MKHLFLSLILCFSLITSFAGEWVRISADQPTPATITLLNSGIENPTIQFSISGFTKTPVLTPQGQAFVIEVENGTPILRKGFPDLPKLTASVMIPDFAEMDAVITSSEYIDFEGIYVAPSKGNFTRDIDPNSVPYEYGRTYTENRFVPGRLEFLREPYIVRDYRGQTIVVQPFRYNSITKTLRVYYNVTIELRKISDNGQNPLVRNQPLTSVNREFDNIYARQFMNYEPGRYTPVNDHGKMLIISYGAFMDAMNPYIEWKRSTGMQVEIVNVSTIGNAAAIKTYVANYYNTNTLTFLLLVGDGPQVPTSSTSAGPSDHNYAYIVGSDHYPDLFVGRFSAENVAQVQTQVQRTIEYEMTPTAGDWYKTSIGVASNQGPGDDNEYDYQHIRNMQTQLLDYTYTGNKELFDGSQGGNDAPGNPSPAQVATDVNAGGSIILYTGHGSQTSWGSSGFSNSNVNTLTNVGKLPFVWSVACVNGDFVSGTCFAEAWLRANQGGQPTGAIAFLGSTINQSWDPPMEGQDEMVDILAESYPNNIKRTFGGISMNGCMKMNDTYGSGGWEMTDTWLCFGDPSVVVRTDVPQNLQVSHNPTVFVGGTSLNITCPTDGAIAAATFNGELIGSATVTGGTASIGFAPLNNVGTIHLVVTAYNKIPYIVDIEVIPASGPYVVYSSYTINDVTGNNNGVLDYGEAVQLNVALSNVGITTANNVVATLSSTDQYVTITDATENFGNIAANQVVNVDNAFGFSVAENVPDNQVILFNLEVVGEQTWTSSFTVTAHSGSLEFAGFEIIDNSGNNNGKLDPGETAQIKISVDNTGSSGATNVMGSLVSSSMYISIQTSSQNFGSINAGSSAFSLFTVTAAANTPIGHTANFTANFTADLGLTATGNFMAVVGQIPVLIVDKDGNANSASKMKLALEEIGVPYDYSTTFPSDLNLYSSIFICLGIYSDNYTLSSAEGVALAAYLNGGGNLYMEGGDTWYYDTQTAAHTLFHINATGDGSSDLGTVTGPAGSLCEGMSFSYSGDNNWIDRLEAGTGASAILKNSSPAYGTAVAYDGGVYKTIGASHEFGGLTDGAAPSTKAELMSRYLDFFGMNPNAIQANFIADDTQICQQGTVAYTDMSSGNVTSWSWTFEGGTPATSTEENPTVNYAVSGNFNVTLVVSDGSSTSEITMNDYINVMAMPEPAGFITGSNDVCQGETVTYSAGLILNATSYLWSLVPPEAGSFEQDGSDMTINWSNNWSGTATLTVCGMNECGTGTVSTPLNIMVYNCTGIGEGADRGTISVSPNPSNGKFTLNMNLSYGSNTTIQVINTLGVPVFSSERIDKSGIYTQEIELGELSNGVYYLVVNQNGNQQIQKLLIQK